MKGQVDYGGATIRAVLSHSSARLRRANFGKDDLKIYSSCPSDKYDFF